MNNKDIYGRIVEFLDNQQKSFHKTFFSTREIADAVGLTIYQARELNLEPCTAAVFIPQSNGMAERFVKTLKEDYISFMPKPNVRTALHNRAVAIEHYNENHPHCALGYLSPKEYRRQQVTST